MGRVPAAPGSQASPEAPAGLRPTGFDPSRIELCLRVLRIFDGFDGPSGDILWWRTDDKYAPVTMFVNCNDLFAWACADCVEITDKNAGLLEETIAEVAALDDCLVDEAALLWCCRVRGNRPQRPYYKHLDARLHGSFDAAGPAVASPWAYRDRDGAEGGDANAAPVPQDRQARAEGIAK